MTPGEPPADDILRPGPSTDTPDLRSRNPSSTCRQPASQSGGSVCVSASAGVAACGRCTGGTAGAAGDGVRGAGSGRCRENAVAVRGSPLVRAGVSWLPAGQPTQRVQQGAELISAGQYRAIAV